MATTLDDVYAAVIDNADYAETASVSKCRAFITAATRLLLMLPASTDTRSSSGGQSVSYNAQTIRAAIDQASAWLAVNCEGTGQVVHCDLSEYRT